MAELESLFLNLSQSIMQLHVVGLLPFLPVLLLEISSNFANHDV